TLIAGSGTDTLTALGPHDVLEAYNGTTDADTGTDKLVVSGAGSSDTLIGGSAGSTLISNVQGNTLVAGAAQTTAAYALEAATANLVAGTATNASNPSDTLLGITTVVVSAANETVSGDSHNDTLTASGSSDTLQGGSGINTLVSTGSANTLIGGATTA